MNEALKAMKAKPGCYAVALGQFRYVGVEVDEQGRVYQLTPQGQRDGLLSDDGWASGAPVVLGLLADVESECKKA